MRSSSAPERYSMPATDSAGSFEWIYEEFHRPILAHLTRMIGDRSTAEDLCQETFIKALRNWDGRDSQASISAWLYRIATNTAYDYLRRLRRIRFLSLSEQEPNEASMMPDDRIDETELVQRALAQLPLAYRLPLVMHTYEGRSTHEIAEALGCSTSAVKTRLFRARERFRNAYQAA